MKALLICPLNGPAVPHLCASGPLATTPILGDCVAGHWIEHLAALGARQIEVVAADNAGKVLAAVGDGARWGVSINVSVCSIEPTRDEAVEKHQPENDPAWLPAPYDVVSMSHLPGCPEQPLFESYAGWFAALMAWMPLALTPARICVAEVRPGIWVGSRATISPTAKLVAPCWIGDQASVESGAVVGPAAILEDRTVADARSRVTESWIGPDTYVGPMTSVAGSLAWGSTLIDWRTDSSLHVPDPFLLSSLASPHSAAGTDRFGRAIGARAPAASKLGLITAMRVPMGGARDMTLPG